MKRMMMRRERRRRTRMRRRRMMIRRMMSAIAHVCNLVTIRGLPQKCPVVFSLPIWNKSTRRT